MDYRRNEDKLGVPTGSNRLIALSIADNAAVEPVTLTEVKDHLRIDFTDDDSYLTYLIRSARRKIEKYTGLSLVSKIITVHFANYQGGFQLPYGPVRAITTVKNKEGDLIDSADYEFEGIEHLSMVKPTFGFVNIEYTAGYADSLVPADLKLAVLKQIAFDNENRGDENTIAVAAKSIAKSYRRVAWIV